VGSESTDSRWVALPTGALALAGELLGVPVALIGRPAGGETGAFEVRDEQGRRLVLKGDDRQGSFAARRDAVYLTTLLAGAGWPVPRQWIATTDDLQVVVQEFLPGEPIDFVTHPVLDQLLSWHSARRDVAPASEPDGVVSELRRTVTPIPFVGSDSHMLLRAVLESYERWECVGEFGNEHEHVLITRVRIAGLDMGIVDHLRHGPDGRVVEFAAYTQPLVGAVTIARVVAPKIARRRSRARSVVTDVVLRPAPAIVGLADKLISSMAAMHTEDE